MTCKYWLLLFLFNSCGGDFTGYSNDELGESNQEESQNLPDFSTRLTNDLLIAGRQCRGGETALSRGETFNCEPSQWLVTVDNINTCTPEGCTEIEVEPTIATLESTSAQANIEFFDLRSSIPVTTETSNILNGVTVRFGDNQAPRVLFK